LTDGDILFEFYSFVSAMTAATVDDRGGTQTNAIGPMSSALSTSSSKQRFGQFSTHVDVHQSRHVPISTGRLDTKATAARLPTKAHSLAEVYLLFFFISLPYISLSSLHSIFWHFSVYLRPSVP